MVGVARKLALALAVFDAGLGTFARMRPEVVEGVLAGGPRGLGETPSETGRSFVSRWGTTILGYSAVHAVTALFPGPTTFGASASLRAIEAPADAIVARRTEGPAGLLLTGASAFNAAATSVFLLAAWRSRRDGGDEG